MGELNEAIKRINLGAEFYTPEKCYIIELSNTPDDPEVSIARARVARRVITRWHRVVGTTERFVIMEGSGRVEVGSLPPQDVSAGDVVLIPPSCRQRITNLGQGDLIFSPSAPPGSNPRHTRTSITSHFHAMTMPNRTARRSPRFVLNAGDTCCPTIGSSRPSRLRQAGGLT